MTNDYSHELTFAKRLALDANKISDKYYKTDLDFKTKADTSPVSIADEEINQLVIDGVRHSFPNDGVLGEEKSWHKNSDRLWVCDPIDGTIGFSMGESVFMFSIALVVEGKPVLALTRELANGRMFWAIKGKGAFLDNKPISVSTRPIDKAWLAFPSNLKQLYKYQTFYEGLARISYQTNVIHGAVFKGMLVAEGLIDGAAVPAGGHPWDHAAVKLIVEEAGGMVTNGKGLEQRYDQELSGVIVSNGRIHQDILKVVGNS